MKKNTIILKNTPTLYDCACIVGPKESNGPLKESFDLTVDDVFWGEKSFEKAESKFVNETLKLLMSRNNYNEDDIDILLGGDLLNQCIASTFAVRDFNIPFIGLYGACSTFVEGLCLNSLIVNAGYANCCINFSSSHYCSAERQFRLPLEQGSPKAPTSQWTVTGCGCANIKKKERPPYITSVTFGKVIDYNISDIANMGSAMAPAAFDTITKHLEDTNRSPDYYDAIITGDLGKLGSEILLDLCSKYNIDISKRHIDCGCLIFDLNNQDIKCGGSGCGCISSVFSGEIFKKLKNKQYNKILLVATGALMSPLTSLQGETIPCIAHAISIENDVEGLKWN